MSRESPWGRPSTMSIITTSSASPFWTIRIAAVAPTNPLPTTVARIWPPWRKGMRTPSYGVRQTGGPSPDGPGGLRGDLQACLLQHQHEVMGLGRGPEGLIHGHQLAPNQAEQGLVEGLHPVEVAVGNDLADLRGPAGVHDPVGDPAVVD